MSESTPRPASPRKARLFGPPAVWVVAALLLLGLTAFAWSTPVTTDTPELRPYTVEYAFDYDAPLPPNPVYEGSSLTFGEPVFLSVLDRVEVEVAMRAMSDSITVDAGELTTKVVVTSSAGWARTLSTSPVTSFTGATATARTSVDFAAALRLAQEIGRTTGTTGSLEVSVVVEATVDGQATTGTEATIDDTSAADLTFALTQTTASPTMPAELSVDESGAASIMPGIVPGTAGASTQTGGASTQTGGASTQTGGASTQTGGASTQTGGASTQTGEASTQTGGASTQTGGASTQTGDASSQTGGASTQTGDASSQTGDASGATGGASRQTGEPDATDTGSGIGVQRVTQMVPTAVAQPNRVDFGLFTVDVSFLRNVVTPLALVCLAAAVASVLIARDARRRGEAAWIAARHGSRLIAADQVPEHRVAGALDLSSFDALRSLSVELEQLILVDSRGPGTDYYITDGVTTYRYRSASATSSPSPATAPSAAPPDATSAETRHDAEPAPDADPESGPAGS